MSGGDTAMTREAVIVDAVRTPVGRGRPGGALADIHPSDLLAVVLRALVDRNGIDPGSVDDVIIGCVSQVGEQSYTPGRMAWLGCWLSGARAVHHDRPQMRLQPAGGAFRGAGDHGGRL